MFRMNRQALILPFLLASVAIAVEEKNIEVGTLIGKGTSEFDLWLKSKEIKEVPKKSKERFGQDGTYWTFSDSGVEVLWTKDEKIRTIWIILVEKEGKKPFKGKPFKEFGLETSFEAVKKTMGKPDAENQESKPGVVKVTPWLRYKQEGFLVHFQFSEDIKTLELVTFMQADWQPRK